METRFKLSVHYPQDQRLTYRDIRLSGAHEHAQALGAIYEEAGGWERPMLCATASGDGKEVKTGWNLPHPSPERKRHH